MPCRRLLASSLLLLAACPGGGDDSGSSGGGTTTATATDASPTSTGEPTTAADSSTGPVDPSTSPTTTTAPTTGDDTTTAEPPAQPTVILPRASISASELMVLANDQDPQSMAVAAYYQQARQIPPENVLTLSFPPGDSLAADAFTGLKAQIDAAAGPQIQAFAVAWTNPHRVDCQSLVSALAFGADKKFCKTMEPCSPTEASPYYDSPSLAPFTDLGVRPAMHLAGVTAEDVYALIDRGVAADGTYPVGTGYFVRTTDVARSVRWPEQQGAVMQWAYDGGLALEYIDNSEGMGADFIENRTDVLFYLTGLADVPQIASNTYLPGAIADHLTSFGGSIPQSGQMSVVRWLEAGATGSYGTAFEPCNYTAKFPSTFALLPHYFRGETLIEAYWKSVAWPGEGVFVGEPLARPWGGEIVAWDGNNLTIETYQLVPGQLYDLQSGDAVDGPWTTVQAGVTVAMNIRAKLSVVNATAPVYRLIAVR